MGSKCILDISNIDDCKNITDNTKYLSIDITKSTSAITSFLANNSADVLITESINNNRGFIYTSYDIFLKAEKVIDNILKKMPSDLSQLEQARYLYISLGLIVGYDINIKNNKNEKINLDNIALTSNLWSSLVNGRVNDISLAKIYLYLCSLTNINCEIITVGNKIKNKIKIDNKELIVDLSKDLFYIQSKYPTVAFASYNNEQEMDKKVGYIKKNYNDKFIDNILSQIDYMDINMVSTILFKTQNILDIDKIKPYELKQIYEYIFGKYCPNYSIIINNLYINTEKIQHFILISYNDKHYSYNYKKKSFVEVCENNLIKNLKENKIGIYKDEFIPNLDIDKRSIKSM